MTKHTLEDVAVKSHGPGYYTVPFGARTERGLLGYVAQPGDLVDITDRSDSRRDLMGLEVVKVMPEGDDRVVLRAR
jgi:hypothetical protein